MSVRIQTDEGVATICGDAIYNVETALIDRIGKVDALEPTLSQQFTVDERHETAAILRALSGTRFLLPGHDRAAVIEAGRVVGRVEGTTIPGPVTPLA